MAITKNLNFTRRHLRDFARLLKEARLHAGLTQLQVANAAFDYRKSHCKVSRVERGAMTKVDAYAIERIADVLGVPKLALQAIDPQFSARASIVKTASRHGFWAHSAA